MVAGQGRGWAETGEMGEGEVSDHLGFYSSQYSGYLFLFFKGFSSLHFTEFLYLPFMGIGHFLSALIAKGLEGIGSS